MIAQIDSCYRPIGMEFAASDAERQCKK